MAPPGDCTLPAPKGAAVSTQNLVGWLLVSGLVTFTVGAARWRLEYEQPLETSLPLKAAATRRLRWIHYWMMIGVALTSVGLGATAVLAQSPWGAVAAVLYAMGATAWLIALTFRLTVEEWAAAETVTTGTVPSMYPPLAASWVGLYGLHMMTAYIAAIPLAFVVAAEDLGPGWLGWAGGVWGAVFAAGFMVTRGAGLFSPPILAHLFTGAVGVALLLD